MDKLEKLFLSEKEEKKGSNAGGGGGGSDNFGSSNNGNNHTGGGGGGEGEGIGGNSVDIYKYENNRNLFAMMIYTLIHQFILDKVNKCFKSNGESLLYIQLLDLYSNSSNKILFPLDPVAVGGGGSGGGGGEMGEAGNNNINTTNINKNNINRSTEEMLVNYTTEKMRELFYQYVIDNSTLTENIQHPYFHIHFIQLTEYLFNDLLKSSNSSSSGSSSSSSTTSADFLFLDEFHLFIEKMNMIVSNQHSEFMQIKVDDHQTSNSSGSSSGKGNSSESTIPTGIENEYLLEVKEDVNIPYSYNLFDLFQFYSYLKKKNQAPFLSSIKKLMFDKLIASHSSTSSIFSTFTSASSIYSSIPLDSLKLFKKPTSLQYFKVINSELLSSINNIDHDIHFIFTILPSAPFPHPQYSLSLSLPSSSSSSSSSASSSNSNNTSISISYINKQLKYYGIIEYYSRLTSIATPAFYLNYSIFNYLPGSPEFFLSIPLRRKKEKRKEKKKDRKSKSQMGGGGGGIGIGIGNNTYITSTTTTSGIISTTYGQGGMNMGYYPIAGSGTTQQHGNIGINHPNPILTPHLNNIQGKRSSRSKRRFTEMFNKKPSSTEVMIDNSNEYGFIGYFQQGPSGNIPIHHQHQLSALKSNIHATDGINPPTIPIPSSATPNSTVSPVHLHNFNQFVENHQQGKLSGAVTERGTGGGSNILSSSPPNTSSMTAPLYQPSSRKNKAKSGPIKSLIKSKLGRGSSSTSGHTIPTPSLDLIKDLIGPDLAL